MRRKIISEMNGLGLGDEVTMEEKTGVFRIAVFLNVGRRKHQDVPPGRYVRLWFPSGELSGLITLGKIKKHPKKN